MRGRRRSAALALSIGVLLGAPVHGCGDAYDTADSVDAGDGADVSAPDVEARDAMVPIDADAMDARVDAMEDAGDASPSDASPSDASPSDASPSDASLTDACVPQCLNKCAGPDSCGGQCATVCALPATCGGGGSFDQCGCTASSGAVLRSPTTALSVGGAGLRSWINSSYILVGQEASVEAMTDGEVSGQLRASGFGFQIPSTAVIKGVELIVVRGALSGIGIVDNTVRLLKAGIPAGVSKAKGATWGTTMSTVTYGSSIDLWGAALSPADVNSPSFGGAFSVKYTSFAGNDHAFIRSMTMRVYYDVSCD